IALTARPSRAFRRFLSRLKKQARIDRACFFPLRGRSRIGN
ncbi:hypothetical protein AZ014_004989, partial [Klebsiella pneumoniae]